MPLLEAVQGVNSRSPDILKPPPRSLGSARASKTYLAYRSGCHRSKFSRLSVLAGGMRAQRTFATLEGVP